MRTSMITIVALTTALLFTACGFVKSPDGQSSSQAVGPHESTGLALTTDTLADTDIERMTFEVTPVDCSSGTPTGPVESETVDYEEMYIPGGIGTFENKPYDEDSQHIFADSYFLVDAGCYDVKTQPMRSATEISKDCKPAHKSGVRVKDGKTTEILLVNQCEGAKRGGLDVLGTINHPPEIDDLEFDNSKFVTSCQPQTTVCLTASDPDDDPLEFEFKALKNAPNSGTITPTGPATYDAQTGQWTACASVETNAKGAYSFRARVFDLDGNGTRIEKVLAQQHPNDNHESRDTIRFPIYAGVECPVAQDCDCKSAVTVLPFDVDRNNQTLQISDLSRIEQGDLVTANFEVAAGCNPVEVSFAAYEAPAPTFSLPQTLVSSDTGSFGPGTHSLSVAIPACFYQTDLVCGPVLSGTDLNNGQRYGSKKLDWDNGGTNACGQGNGQGT